MEARAVLKLSSRSKWVNGSSPLTPKKKAEESRNAKENKKLEGAEVAWALPWLLSSCCEDAEPHGDIAADLKRVNRNLQAILRKQRRLQLHAAYAADPTVHTRTLLRRQPTDPGIVGTRIEDDARLLVDRLTQTGRPATCEVVAIVGPDGLGKTKLARMVYESARVRCSFGTTSWVRLSRGYTEAGLLSQVIDAFGGDTKGGESVADLQAMLTGLVANKRFLLVVDDVWYGGQCFLYCSLFPPGFAVERRVLVQHWMAERLVQTRSGASVEEVAEGYYDELVGRNLLQTTQEDVRGCTMHEALHALAQLLLQGEGFTGDGHRLPDDGDTSFRPRRVSLPGRNMATIPESILNSEMIRTLLLPRNPLATEGNIFTRLHHQLRVLDLSETGIELIPETLGNMVHLRLLNLSRTGIQAIPESISNLWSLKFLLLRECKSLHALPKGMKHLRGLRDLDLAGTTIDIAAFRVGQLRSLTSLQCFAVASKEDRGGWPLAELKHLCQLRILHVHKLQRAPGRSEAAEVALASKMSLRELALSSSDDTVSLPHTPTAVRKIEDVLEELNPPPCLESLKIAGYFGAKFPSWLSDISLPNLRRLDIIGCNLCQSLPPLGLMPELRSLSIVDSSALTSIDAEFMGKCHHPEVPFPKLENLRLQGLPKLETWMDIEAGTLPSLQAMQLESCPELRRLPGGLRHVTSLVELRIVDMASLEAVEDIIALRELSVWNAPDLKKLSDMPSLEDLSISHCPVLQTLENVDSLRAVHIFDHQLQEIPRWIEARAAKLRSLDVTSTIKLLKRCLVDGPDWPLIKDIVQVHGSTTGSGDYIYYSKSPYIFDSNVNAQGNVETAASDSADEASAENRNANQDVGVTASGTGYMHISGFFDSKAVKKGAPMAEGNVTHRNTERRNSQRRMHKLAEVIPEEGEAEEDADSVVLFPDHRAKSHSRVEKQRPVVKDDRSGNNDTGLLSKVTPQETGPDATRRRRSKMGEDVHTDAGAAGDSSVSKSAAAVGHNLVREGSRVINCTETDQNSNISVRQSEECTLNKGEDFANISKQTRRVHDTASKVPTQVVGSDSKVFGNDKTENSSPAIMARSRQVTFNIREDDHADADVHSPNTINQKNVGKVKVTTTSASASTNATTMPEIPADREVAPKSVGTIDSSLILEVHHTVSITKDSTCTGVDNTGGHMEDRSISLPANPNHEESKACSATETTCDSEPCMLPASLAWRKQRGLKKQEASFAGAGGGIGASIKKIPRMTNKTSEKVTYKSKAGPMEHPSTGASKNTDPHSNPACTPYCAIGTTEATMAYRHHTSSYADNDNAHFSIDIKADDSHQAPKVYTAIWADTDTDTLRARFLSSMQHHHRMASRRRHRHRRAKHSSGNTWSISPVLVIVLLVVSVAQLLFIIWMYRRLLNQKVADGEQNPYPPVAEDGEIPNSPPAPPKREIVRVTKKTIRVSIVLPLFFPLTSRFSVLDGGGTWQEKASAFSSVGSSAKRGAGASALDAAVFKRFNGLSPEPLRRQRGAHEQQRRARGGARGRPEAEAAGDEEGEGKGKARWPRRGQPWPVQPL
ncbi:Putative disease resistance RPP13-like protein 1 [Triticum urartu]|uniref:Putative disease resistance RPP13-like protein 1 n=1 Tax=Triticum urartu TaxID=4572 RepID=M7ZF42_TRIUA|nr:Putative disease resistance RPP13-like protein 1 [Triticum urartu]